MAREKALVSWSSGKDSAWTLHVLRERGDVEVVGLLTTLNAEHERVSMHAVREALLAAQAAAAGLPLLRVPLPDPCSNHDYEVAMGEAIDHAQRLGVSRIAFGDLFLEDVRRYREQQLASTGIQPLFPLWGEPTADLAQRMTEAGLRAHLSCVDPSQLAPGFAGRTYDARLLSELPESVDPCGERGEFHTFVTEGPMFREPVPVRVGETIERGGFVYADLVPA